MEINRVGDFSEPPERVVAIGEVLKVPGGTKSRSARR
jgi:hypothetical protein